MKENKFMRQLFTVLLSTFAFLPFTNTYGENLSLIPAQLLEEQPSAETIVQKVYVHPSQIYFSDNQIFVQTPKGLMPVHSLKTDAKGIHYRTAHPQSWYCQYVDKQTGKKCGYYNTFTYYCEECGHSPDDW